MKYAEMTSEEIRQIINRGGSELAKLNQQVADFLDGLELSSRSREIISQTDINVMAECFGGLETAEEVEEYIRAYYPEEE